MFFLGFLVCYAATQLRTPLHQRHIQVVRSNKVAQKHLTESQTGESTGGDPIYGLGCLYRPGTGLSKACGDRGGS